MKKPGNKGFFLILVVAVVAALAAILVRFGVEAQLSAMSSGNFRDEVVARLGAQSVLEGVKAVILTGQWQHPGLISFISKQMLKEVSCRGWVENEEGKLPVNRLIASGPEGVAILRRYWEERGCSLQSLNALIDWVDKDDTTFNGGSEAAYYGSEGLVLPNRPLQSIYELPAIPFMRRDLKRLKKSKASPLYRGLTVWGTGKVNLLTAGRDVLMALSDDMTLELADRILAEREGGQIQTMGDFKRVVHVPDGVYESFQKWGTLEGVTCQARIEAVYRKMRVMLRAVLSRRGFDVRVLYFREGLWLPG